VYVNINEDEMGGVDGPGKSDRLAIVEALKAHGKNIMTMIPQQEDIINKPESKIRFRIL
jgi:hypothetical protein